MTTDVVNTIVASDEKNVNKFDKDRGFSEIAGAGNAPSHPEPDSHCVMEPNCVAVHRVEIIPEVLEIRLRKSY
jgi:hypothetical protein